MTQKSNGRKKSSKPDRKGKPKENREVIPRRQETVKKGQQGSIDAVRAAEIIECLPIPQDVKDQVVGGLLQGDKDQIVKFEETISASGYPIPLPQILAAYGEIDPDIVPRFLRAWESEEKTRQRLEDEKLRAQIEIEHLKHKERSRGQFYGLLIGLAGMIISAYMVYSGNPTQATIFGSGTIVSLVAVFVLRKLPARKDKAQDSIPLEDRKNGSN